MKRMLAVLLGVCLLLSLTGCAYIGEQLERRENRGQLRGLLDQVAENIKEGESPVTLQLTADFVSWACSTELTQEEVSQVVSDWLADQSPSIRLAAEEKLNEMLDSLTGILKDGAEKAKSWDIQSVLQEILSSGGID